MDDHGWTRERLRELAAGRRLFMRSLDAEFLPIPDWLTEVAAEASPKDSAESVESTHPEDRNRLIEIFIESLEKPGEACTGQIRVFEEADDEWQHLEMVWINLVDHPDVKGVLCAARQVDGPEIIPPTIGFKGVMSATNWMILAIDLHGRIVQVRGRMEEILGYTPDDVHGTVMTDLIHHDCVHEAIANWLYLIENPAQTRTSRWVWNHKDGSPVWLESSYLVHEATTRDEIEVEVILLDVNDQVANEEALAESQRQVATLAEDFRLLADEVPTAVFRCDAEGRVQFHNAHWSEMFADQGDLPRVQDLISDSERERFDDLLASLTGDQTSTAQSIEVQAAGAPRVLEIRCRAATGDADSRRFVGSITDVTAAAVFRHQALHDPLTGLANRAMIEARLADAVQADPDRTLVVFIDLDGFKAVNDEHGHEAGDAILVEVARRLSTAVRPGDAVARFGGDEFVVVCHGVSPGMDHHITHRLENVFGTPIKFNGMCWTPRASFGVARPESGVDSATVLRRADQAMFDEKRSRRAAGR